MLLHGTDWQGDGLRDADLKSLANRIVNGSESLKKKAKERGYTWEVLDAITHSQTASRNLSAHFHQPKGGMSLEECLKDEVACDEEARAALAERGDHERRRKTLCFKALYGVTPEAVILKTDKALALASKAACKAALARAEFSAQNAGLVCAS